MSKTFCPLAWTSQAIRNNGDIRICCQANITKNKGILRNNGTPLNAAKDDLSSAINNELMKEIRLSMLSGEWHKECFRCKTEEENNLRSKRISELEINEYSYENALKDTDTDGTISPNLITKYDIRFGNFCNLACRMCGPHDSSMWYEQWLEYHGGIGFQDTHGFVELKRNEKNKLYSDDYNWYESDVFWNNLEKNINNIHHIYLAGGEPLLIEKHFVFLSKCVERGVAKNIILEYNTNLTTLPPRITNLWTKFKNVYIGASIDGYGKVLEYQRWPAKWDSVYKNLNKLNELMSVNNNIKAWYSTTITIYNIWHIPEFMWWILFDSNLVILNESTNSIIKHHIAHRPIKTNIKILNINIKNKITNHYSIWSGKIDKTELNQNMKNRYKQILNSILKYMNSEDWTDKLPEFINFTSYLDRVRNQKILEIVPDYKDLFNE